MSIETYDYPDGLTVTVDYDLNASDPHEDFDYLFSGVERNDRNSIRSDNGEIMHDYDLLLDEIENEEMGIENDVHILKYDKKEGQQWWENADEEELECIAGALEELIDLYDRRDNRYFNANLRARNEYGAPEFRVTIDLIAARKETGNILDTPEQIEQFAQGIVDSYAAWAEVSVFELTFDYPNGDTEYLSGHYTVDSCSPDPDECRMYAEDYAPDGAFETVEDNAPVLSYAERVKAAMIAESVDPHTAERVIKRLTTTN